MQKVSLNKEHPKFDLFKAGLSFRSADGKSKTKDGLPFHNLKEHEYVLTNDVPNAVIVDKRFIVENVDEKKTKKGE